jgi:hypothetical protein
MLLREIEEYPIFSETKSMWEDLKASVIVLGVVLVILLFAVLIALGLHHG